MNDTIDKNRWVFILILNPEKDEEYIAFEDNGVPFVPAFDSKEDAAAWKSITFSGDDGKIEIQALYLTDLLKETKESGYLVYILDKQGQKQETF